MPGERLRQFSRTVLNPVVRGWAGSAWGPFALLIHTGRHSGHIYKTPVEVRRVAGGAGDGFVIALTYGTRTDWYRNLVAANGGSLRWRGRSVPIGPPELIPLAEALAAFRPAERAIIRLVGITQFVRVRAMDE